METRPQFTAPQSSLTLARRLPASISLALGKLKPWIEAREFAGYEPYDLLNSRRLPAWLKHGFPFNWVLVQTGKHLPGHWVRQLLGVPQSRNPKAIGLFLSGYCDLARCGEGTLSTAESLKRMLVKLRSPQEKHFCWGYDWDYVSLRGSNMRAFHPNAIASVFCGHALLDMSQVFGDGEAAEMAKSVGRFFVERLNRPVDTASHLCFSYTPENATRIINVTALVGAFLARLAQLDGDRRLEGLARRSLQYVVDHQQSDGSWPYGMGRGQHWVDSFHTGYNLCALLEYAEVTGDGSFCGALNRGYEFYKSVMMVSGGIPKYFKDCIYPIDIHACSQAIILAARISPLKQDAANLALSVLQWTVEHMQAPEGYFYYQRHRWWTNKTPYMRWGQAWMFRSLCYLQTKLGERCVSAGFSQVL